LALPAPDCKENQCTKDSIIANRLGIPRFKPGENRFSFEAIANRHGTTALSLKVFLKTSHENMPNLVIAPDQADALASYILSLKTN